MIVICFYIKWSRGLVRSMLTLIFGSPTNVTIDFSIKITIDSNLKDAHRRGMEVGSAPYKIMLIKNLFLQT